MQKTWKINVDGTEHTVDYTFSAWSNKRILSVDGKQYPLDTSSFKAFVGIEQPVNVGGKTCQLVQTGGKADLAVDGVFLDSGAAYAPLKMPWWGWIFAVLNFSLIMMGGALPAGLGILGVYLSAQKAADVSRPTGKRVLACVGVTVLMWAICIAASVAITLALNG